MDKFATKPEQKRRAILQEAASRRDLADIILEKDFWVCWTLKRLFSNPALSTHLTFKDGTSLSKANGLIERFSEDIDLTIALKKDYDKMSEMFMAEHPDFGMIMADLAELEERINKV